MNQNGRKEHKKCTISSTGSERPAEGRLRFRARSYNRCDVSPARSSRPKRPAQGRGRQGDRPGAIHRRPHLSRSALRAHRAIDDPGRRDCRDPLQFRHRRLHHRRPPRHPGTEHRRADRRRSALSGGARRSAMSRSRSCCWRTPIASACCRADVADRLPARPRRSSTRRRPARRSRPFASTRATSTRGWRRPISSSRANIAPVTRSSSTSSPTASSPCPMRSRRDHGVRVDAVPVLRAPVADRAARSAPTTRCA